MLTLVLIFIAGIIVGLVLLMLFLRPLVDIAFAFLARLYHPR